MALAEKLTALNNIKLDIKNELSAAGHDMTNVTFSQYAALVNEKLKAMIDGSIGSLAIPAGVESIRANAFRDAGFYEIIIPDTVLSIGDYSFGGCGNIQHLDISGVENIGYYAFSNCQSLQSIVLGGNLHEVKNFAFEYCTALRKVYYRGTETEWKSITIGAGNEQLTSIATIQYNYAG